MSAAETALELSLAQSPARQRHGSSRGEARIIHVPVIAVSTASARTNIALQMPEALRPPARYCQDSAGRTGSGSRLRADAERRCEERRLQGRTSR